MINLLLPEDRQGLRKEYRRRRLAVFGGAVLVVLIVSTVALGSIYYLVFLEERSARRHLAEVASGAEATAASAAIDAIKLANEQAALVVGRERFLPSGLVAALVEHASPAAVALQSFNYSGEGKGVKLVGTAATRADFLAFLAVLHNEKLFAKVDSPVENLISERNINFTINLSLN